MTSMARGRTPMTANSMASSVSSVSMPELPNLPGVRRDVSLINPKLYREFKASQGISAPSTAGSVVLDEENSLMSYFEGSQQGRSLELSRMLSPFPQNSSSFNDLKGRYSLKSQKEDRVKKLRTLPFSSTESLPSFVTNDRRMFCFFAYFSEPARDGIPDRSRKVNIKFYMEDNSIEIMEPREENSGTSQGKFLKRHQISKPARNSADPSERETSAAVKDIYTLDDMHSGAQLNIYGRNYTLYDADNSTRHHLEEIGRTFGPSLGLPGDVYDPKSRPGALQPSTRQGRAKGKALHFQYDRKVLRFYGLWDCRQMLFGDELRVKVHYSLAENTMEVVPIHERNSGRDRLPKLLKKTQIMMRPPMNASPTRDFGDFSAMSTVSSQHSDDEDGGINGSSSGLLQRTSSAHLPLADRPTHSSQGDSLQSLVQTNSGGSGAGSSAMVPTRPYHWTDLRIGEEIPVASMTVLLVDADEFTREFYNSKNMPLDPPIRRPPPQYPQVMNEIPPYNGFGSEDDSLATCKSTLMPCAPSKDGAKLKALANMILRYEATMVDPTEADKSRKFIIQVHLEDDTFQIREPPIRNSGHKGGIFLRRSKLETHDGSKPLQPYDLHLGAEVSILTHKFKVHNCDAFSFKYMEENCKKWLHSDIKYVLKKVTPKKEVLKRLILTYPALTSRVVDAEELQSILEKAGINAVQQEAYTLFRAVDVSRVGSLKLTKILKFIIDLPDK